MSEVHKYPNGYDVTVCNRRDILACLDENIVDKQVLSAIIEDLEDNIWTYIQDGKSAGIPYLGSISFIEDKKIRNSEEIKELKREGRELMSKEEYCMFKHKLNKEIQASVGRDRFYKYTIATFITHNFGYFRFLCKTHTEAEARLISYSMRIYTLEDQYRTYHGSV